MRPQAFKVITEPTSEPLSLADAKDQCKSELTEDNDRITFYIKAARQIAETHTRRCLMEQTVEAKYADWPDTGFGIWLPRPPAVSVTGVYYYDTDGTEQTLSSSVYELDADSEPAQICLKPNQSWPALQTGKNNPIRVRYVAGHSSAANVPAATVQGIRLLVGTWFDHPKDTITGTIVQQLPMAAETLFAHDACWWGI